MCDSSGHRLKLLQTAITQKYKNVSETKRHFRKKFLERLKTVREERIDGIRKLMVNKPDENDHHSMVTASTSSHSNPIEILANTEHNNNNINLPPLDIGANPLHSIPMNSDILNVDELNRIYDDVKREMCDEQNDPDTQEDLNQIEIELMNSCVSCDSLMPDASRICKTCSDAFLNCDDFN